jgi:hypothetical protein
MADLRKGERGKRAVPQTVLWFGYSGFKVGLGLAPNLPPI